MEEQIIRETIREILFKEFLPDKNIESKIDEFGRLSDKIDRVKNELERLNSEYRMMEKELRPVLEELEKFDLKSIRTKNYLLSIKRMGYNRENYKYKEVFEKSLTKVNKQTQRVLKELLQQTKTITKVVSSIGVQPIGENIFKGILNKLRTMVRRLLPSVKKVRTDLDELEKISLKIIGNRS